MERLLHLFWIQKENHSYKVKSEVAKENNENYLTDEEQHKIIIKDYDMLFEYRE